MVWLHKPRSDYDVNNWGHMHMLAQNVRGHLGGYRLG
jgi:hypothetical protein